MGLVELMAIVGDRLFARRVRQPIQLVSFAMSSEDDRALRRELAAVADLDHQVDRLAVAEDDHGHRLAGLGQADEIAQMIGVLDGRAVELQDDVARLQLGGRGGRAGDTPLM